MARDQGKPVRLATRRTPGCVEWIEQQPHGVLFWKGVDRLQQEVAEWSFFVDVDFAAEFMTSVGRQFDETKLPYPVVCYPRNG